MTGSRTRRWAAAALPAVAALALSGCRSGSGDHVAVAPAARTADPTPYVITSGPAVGPPGPGAPPVLVPPAPVPRRAIAPPVVAPIVTCAAPWPKVIALQALPGTGSATLTWPADGDPLVSGYRVTAVSQRLVAGSQPTPPTKTVAKSAGCGQVSVTMTGLASGVPYVFWLEENIVATSTSKATTIQVGTSPGVVVH